MYRLPGDFKIDLSVEPGKYRAIVSKRMRLTSPDDPEIEASIGVRVVYPDAANKLLSAIAQYEDNKTQDDRQRDAIQDYKQTTNAPQKKKPSAEKMMGYRPAKKKSHYTPKAGRGGSEMKAAKKK